MILNVFKDLKLMKHAFIIDACERTDINLVDAYHKMIFFFLTKEESFCELLTPAELRHLEKRRARARHFHQTLKLVKRLLSTHSNCRYQCPTAKLSMSNGENLNFNKIGDKKSPVFFSQDDL